MAAAAVVVTAEENLKLGIRVFRVKGFGNLGNNGWEEG